MYSWQVNTPFTRDIIRGRVHIRAHWSRSCRGRRFYADVYHFTSPPPASSSSVSHPWRARVSRLPFALVRTMIRHTCPVVEFVEEDRKPVRTCYECVNRPALNDCRWLPWYPAALPRASTIKNSVPFRLVLRYRAVRINEARDATQDACIAVSISSQETALLHRLERRIDVIERGPTWHAQSPICDGRFNRGLRENTKRLPASKGRTKGTRDPVSLSEKYIHASTNFCGGETRSCLGERADRSIARSIFKGPLARCGVIWSRNTNDTNRETRWRCRFNGRCYALYKIIRLIDNGVERWSLKS